MATQDLTTYTETDTPSKLTVTTTRVTATGILGSDDNPCTVVKDFGADYFDSLNAYVTCAITAAASFDTVETFILSVGTVADSYTGMAATDLGVYINLDASGRIALIRGNFVASDTVDGITEANPHYLTLTRSAGGDVATLLVYTDSDRTVLLDTLTVAGYGTVKWRYNYAFNHKDNGTAGSATMYYENIDFEAPSGPPKGGCSLLGVGR